MFLVFRRQILHGPREDIDLVVGSQGGLSKLFHEKYMKRHRVSTIALDEIDTLLDDTFKVVENILRTCSSHMFFVG